MANDAYVLQGGNGGIVLTGTDSWTAAANNEGRAAVFIQATEDTAVASYAGNLIGGDTKLTGLPAGMGVGGRTTAITLTSGTVILYY